MTYHPLAAAAKAAAPIRAPIPDRQFVQVCQYIEPDPFEIEKRYAALTRELPLAGADALKLINGQPALTAHLLAETPWLKPAIDRIDTQLRVQIWAGRPWVAFRPLLLVGPPGCGKSHFARLIATCGGTGHTMLSLAGASDNRLVEGTARGWANAQPCLPALSMVRSRTANPVIVLDEIDKISRRPNGGDPLGTLLAMTEPSTARQHYDQCLLAPVDISHVNWILTANDISSLPGPLRSRLDIVVVDGPMPEHFDQLLVSLIRTLAKRWTVPPSMMPAIHPGAEALLRQRFEQHRSVRRLAREIEDALAAAIPMRRLPLH